MKKLKTDFLKALVPPVLIAALATAILLVPVAPLASADAPSENYEPGDACGYIEGDSIGDTTASGGGMNFDDVVDTYQACVDADGYFHEAGARQSFGWSEQLGWVDFAWDTTSIDPSYLAHIDPSTGFWSGYAWNETFGWLWFDWTSDTSSTSLRVHTDTSNGAVSGYAWNDTVGWISFNYVTQELAPASYSPIVSINTADGVLPEDVDLNTAPLSDGYQYYRLKMVFSDPYTGDNLDGDDLGAFNIDVNAVAGSFIRLNQVDQSSDWNGDGVTDYNTMAVTAQALNHSFTECNEATDFTLGDSCYLEDGGEPSYNYFISSASPSSNMLGVDESRDNYIVDYFADRLGGIGFYSTADTTTKLNYYYDRDSNLNQYALDSIDFDLTVVNPSRWVEIDGCTVTAYTATSTPLSYDCSYDTSDNPELSFRPRFLASLFKAVYDGEESNLISNDTSINMTIRTVADIEPQSDEFRAAYNAIYSVNPPDEQTELTMNIAVNSSDNGASGYRLYIDSDTPSNNIVDAWQKSLSNIRPIYGSSPLSLDKSYAMEYATAACAAADSSPTCGGGTGTPTSETAEQWVCDKIAELTSGGMQPNRDSCYYVGYLEIPDRHADPENMEVIGAINSSIDFSDLFGDSDDVSVFGFSSYITQRNNMLAQALRLVRGQSPNGGAGVLNEKLQIRSGSTDEIIASMNAKLLYATGDVTIQNTGLSGSLEFDPKTLFIYGGDMYINTNILGRAGIVVLKKNGQGGNIYIDPSVTDINANIFADGSVFSSSTAYDANGVPTRSSDDARLTDLPHQLAIFGTVVSRNTIGGFSDPNAGTWNTGNGETTNNSDTAIEYDLNKLRQFRLCYPVDSGGNIIEDDSLLEDCGEGAERSTLYTGTSNAPLIIQYEPPTEDMPIFNTVSPDINQR